MARQLIDIGTAANDGTGDTLREGGEKINDNFAELYASLGETVTEFATAERWRVRTTAAGSDGDVGWGEIIWQDAGGASLGTIGTAEASTELTGWEASKAFNSIVGAGDGWKPDGVEPMVGSWCGFDYDAAKSPRSVRLRPINDEVGAAPEGFVIEYYNGSAWVVVGTHSHIWASNLPQTFTIDPPAAGDALTTDSVLDDLADVMIYEPADGEVLKYNSGTSLWENAPEDGGGGITVDAEETGTTYTFVLADAETVQRFSNAGAITVTVPPNSSVAFPTDTYIEIWQTGAGVVTLAPGSGVTINSRDGLLSLSGQYAGAALRKVDTDVWMLEGALA